MPRDVHTYDDLLQALERKTFSPVYLFHGGEDFLAEEAADAVVQAALTHEERQFNLDVTHGSETDARDIASHASSFPLGAERRVVVVREFDKLSNKELLSSYIEHPSPTTCLILLSEKADFRRKPFVTAKRHGFVVEFRPLYDNQVPGWIEKRVRQQGHMIDSEACKVLAAYAGSSMREIQSEIDKLYLYVGDKRAVTVDDVQAVVGMSKEFNIFELQRSIGSKDLRRSVEVLERMLDVRDSSTMIIAMLTKYFATLWKINDMRKRGLSSQEQARIAGINPFFFKEYQTASEFYSVAEIEQAFTLLANADEEIKTTSTDPKHIMHLMLVQLLASEQLVPR